jgi:hypothetical protein
MANRTPTWPFCATAIPTKPTASGPAQLGADLAEASAGDMVARLKGQANAAPAHAPHGQPAGAAGADGPLLARRRHGRHGPRRPRPQSDPGAVFGLHAARLDLRQYSEYNTAVLDELLGRLDWSPASAQIDGPGRAAALTDACWPAPRPDLTTLDRPLAETPKRSTCSGVQARRRLLRPGTGSAPTSSA